MIKRFIARLDIKNNFLVKGIHLEGLRFIGHADSFAKKYYNEGVDEIFLSDAVASLYGRNSLHQIIKKISTNIFVPITVAGGLRKLKDIEKLLKCGADKVAINSAIVRNPNFLKSIVKNFGSSTITSQIDYKNFNNEKYIFIDNGREQTNIKLIDWVKKIQDYGAGEIILTSIDNDGTGKGYDLETIRKLSKITEIPIIPSGGAGNLSDISNVLKVKDVNSFSIASMLHYHYFDYEDISRHKAPFAAISDLNIKKQNIFPYSVDKIKNYLKNQNIQIRK